jgi:two-component system C4-dicarboxylate transport sensor histidine kinase DctB
MVPFFASTVCLLLGFTLGRRRAPSASPPVVQKVDRFHLRSAHTQRLAILGSQAAGTAHEMNGALSVLYCLAEELELAGTEREMVEALRTTTRNLHALTKDMTGFSRLSPSGTHCDLSAGVKRAIRMTRADLRGVCVVESWVDGMPPVAVEEGRLVQILVNLFRNSGDAIRDAEGGRIRVTAQLESVPPTSNRMASSRVLILVEDDGPGVDGAIAGQLFERFQTTKDDSKGTGLGLNISRNIARQVDGDLGLAPGVLGGACFALRIPVFTEVLKRRAS